MKALNYIGKPINRVDGRLKVTGEAQYAADFEHTDGLVYGYVVSSPIAKGKITSVDTQRALQQDGVLQVFTHENVPNLAWFNISYRDQDAPSGGAPFRPLQSDEIQFNQQPIALVVAETFELARYAATLIDFTFEAAKDTYFGLPDHLHRAKKPTSYRIPPAKPRGDAEKAYKQAAVQVEADYYHGYEHHNPMELFGSTVIYGSNGRLTVYDKTQGVINSLTYLKKVFGVTLKVQVKSPFMGGGFGSGLRPQYQLYLAVLAALELKKSVKVVLTRQQMFSFGHRPATLQKIAIGASVDGKIEAIINRCFSETSTFEDYTEDIVNWSGLLYHCDNVLLEHQVVPLDLYTPLDMRAPGGATGVYALEIAIDELAYKVGMDPLAFRLKNYTEIDQNKGLPFSSKELKACYKQGAEKFGWEKRPSVVRATQRGNDLLGWGMATGCWDAQQMPARAKATFSIDGKLTVSSATADIGTGTYTSMTQVAADTLGMPIEDVTFKLGDSSFPLAPLQGGSWTMASVGSAVKQVCEKIKSSLFKKAREMKASPFKKVKLKDVIFANGELSLRADPTIHYRYADILKYTETNYIQKTTTALPAMLKQRKYSSYTHSAIFAEVLVDEDLGSIKVERLVIAVAAGKIINTKTAKSQILGGAVWGMSMALYEDTVMDNRIGRFMNHNLAEYHIPVNLDVNNLEVIFVEEHDNIVNPLGVKGIGEIGIVGTAAAISNAVYHATGKRLRNLPMQLNHLI